MRAGSETPPPGPDRLHPLPARKTLVAIHRPPSPRERGADENAPRPAPVAAGGCDWPCPPGDPAAVGSPRRDGQGRPRRAHSSDSHSSPSVYRPTSSHLKRPSTSEHVYGQAQPDTAPAAGTPLCHRVKLLRGATLSATSCCDPPAHLGSVKDTLRNVEKRPSADTAAETPGIRSLTSRFSQTVTVGNPRRETTSALPQRRWLSTPTVYRC